MANCGACGTPMSKNRFGEFDCPKCKSENFVGFSKKPKPKAFFSSQKADLEVIENSRIEGNPEIEVLEELHSIV